MTAKFKSLGFVKYGKNNAIRSVKAHVKYIEAERSDVHKERPELFDRANDKVDRKDFFERLNQQEERGVVAHKMIISMSADEQQRLGTDLRQLTRDTMEAYETNKNQRLDWVAAIHDDKNGKIHAHIVIRGQDEEGKQIGIYNRDFIEIQTAAEYQKQKQFEQVQLQQREKEDLEQQLQSERSKDYTNQLGRDEKGSVRLRDFEM